MMTNTKIYAIMGHSVKGEHIMQNTVKKIVDADVF